MEWERVGFDVLTWEQERRRLSLQADNNRTAALYCFCTKTHLCTIQSATCGLRPPLCNCVLDRSYLFLMACYGGPQVFIREPWM